VSTAWDFEVTGSFSEDSARKLLSGFPSGYTLCFFDPAEKTEEAWIDIRHEDGQYFMRTLRQGRDTDYAARAFDVVLRSFMSSPLIKRPASGIESFSIYTIPEHQRDRHKTKFSA
jgi:hypothetical protein